MQFIECHTESEKAEWSSHHGMDISFYSHDRMADWELELTATALHHKKVSDCISLA